jgi:site-specific DNA-methyltransferase (adenine-specific)
VVKDCAGNFIIFSWAKAGRALVGHEDARSAMEWVNQVLIGDCIELLEKLPAESIDLAFADPPFNIGYQYDRYDDRRARDDYLAWTGRWLAAVRRVLKPAASFYVAIGDEYAAEMKIRLDQLGLSMRNWIIWHYTFGVNCTKKFNRSHAHIFYYVADAGHYTFNADGVRVPSARLTTYADRRANPVGKLPDDTWILRPQEADGSFRADSDTWYVARVCGTFKERLAHPCQMPEAVLERIIRVSSNPGDTVLDPFAGSGTTLAVAKRLGRRYLGVEFSAEYAEKVRRRLENVTVELFAPRPDFEAASSHSTGRRRAPKRRPKAARDDKAEQPKARS